MAVVDKGKRPMDKEKNGDQRAMEKENAAAKVARADKGKGPMNARGKVSGVDKGKRPVGEENNGEMAMKEENDAGKMARVHKGRRAVDKESNKINIGIYGQLDGVLVTYSMRRNMQLKNLLLKYCEKKHLDYKSTTFLYKRKRLLVRCTPEELRMKNGDQIEAMLYWRSG